ncbi:hypothetical protein Pan216_39950 [Planctomycetes bacterium Pan216]|uniref:Uncharacterized protein n=1 Tax=Kolteria novifilia TaxID=2527975 RepID=A0A518B816_9BACT|nr:hypothetical protein Pan216_39950 [Planctomycetes bacterium Pan216]
MSTYRVYSRDTIGDIVMADFKTLKELLDVYEQVGVEEESYTMRLHGEPILDGLVGPMSEGKTIVRYETPEVFISMTEQWASERRNGRKGRR